MTREFTWGFRLKGDSSSAVKASRLTEQEMRKLRGEMTRAERAAKATGKGFSGLGRTLFSLKGVLAGVGLAAGIRAVVSATVEQEQADKKLRNSLKVTQNQVGLSYKQLKDFAAEMQAQTTLGDEYVQGLETQLLAFTNITGENFKRTIKVIADFAEVTGRSAASSVRTLGVAINDPLNGMSRLRQAGISLTDQQQTQIKTLVRSGKLYEAQAQLLQVLEESYGGAAHAAANTFGGALEQVKNAFGDLLENKTGLPAATKELHNLRDILQDPETKQAFDTITTAVIRLVGWAARGAKDFTDMAESIGKYVAIAQGFGPSTTGRVSPQDRLKQYGGWLDTLKSDNNGGLFGANPKDRILQQLGIQGPATQANVDQAIMKIWDLQKKARGQIAMRQYFGANPIVTPSTMAGGGGGGGGSSDLGFDPWKGLFPTASEVQQRGVQQQDYAQFQRETDAQIQANKELGQSYKMVNGMIIDYGISQKEVANIQDDSSKRMQENAQLAREVGYQFSSAFENAVLSGKKLSDVLKALGRDIMQLALRKMVTTKVAGGVSTLLTGVLNGLGSGGGNSASSGSYSSGSSFSLGLSSSGHRASGGYVSGGSVARVNENGFEMASVGGRDYLLMGGRGGTVTPSGQIGGGTTVVQHITVQGNGDKQLADMMARTADLSTKQALSRVHRELRAGGQSRKLVRS